VGAVVLLSACATPEQQPPGNSGAPVDPAGATLHCAEAFPAALPGVSLDDVADILPADWPDPPAESTLCYVLRLNDDVAVLQYATGLAPDAVLDFYESSFSSGGFSLVRGTGIAGSPILNATSASLDFAVQTVPEEGTFHVSFERAE